MNNPLFHSNTDNLLPYDGTLLYVPNFLATEEAKFYFDTFLDNINWEHDRLFIYGKEIITPRKVAWFGDEGITYQYSQVTKTASPWTKELLALKSNIEKERNEKYNSCLFNLYPSGDVGIAWHADDEKELKAKGSIISISLGAQRKFVVKHKRTKEKIELQLEHGSLLEMKGEIQEHWLHSLPKTKKVQKPRINLTFRQVINQ